MLRVLVVVVIGLAASIARADESLEQTTYITTPLWEEVGSRWQLDALFGAMHSALGDGMQATVGAHYGLAHSKHCELIGIGGELGFRTDAHVITAEQSATTCFLADDNGGYGSIEHHLAWDTVPRLLAMPRLAPGRQRREAISIKLVGSKVPDEIDGVESRGGVIHLDLSFGWIEHHLDFEVSFGVWLREFTKRYASGPPIRAEAFGMNLDMLVSLDRAPMMRHQSEAGGLDFLLAKIDGIRIGGGFRLGGRAGARLNVVDETAREDRSRMVAIGDGGAWIEHDVRDAVVAKLALEARSAPAWNGRLIVDDRATASIAGTFGPITAQAAASIAYTNVIAPGERGGYGTGGVSVDARYAIGGGVDVYARVESGKSVYGPDGTFDHPTWGIDALVLLAGRIESR